MNTPAATGNRKHGVPAFTLIELLVVLAIIALLASLLFPALARAKASAKAAACRNNLRQLAIAFHMYLDDNADTFPTAGPLALRLTSDWIYAWNAAWDPLNPHPITKSPIAAYTGGFITNLVQCPSNPRRHDFLLQFWPNYSLNAGKHGMASEDHDQFRRHAIKQPSMKIMLAEEINYGDPVPSALISGNTSGWYWNGRWADSLTMRHRGKSNAAFADGHIEAVKPEFGQQKEHYDPTHEE